MNPLCSVLAQFNNARVHILEEMIQPDSNTLAACEEFLSRTKEWSSALPLKVNVYGDATGEQRRTSASRTDWQDLAVAHLNLGALLAAENRNDEARAELEVAAHSRLPEARGPALRLLQALPR